MKDQYFRLSLPIILNNNFDKWKNNSQYKEYHSFDIGEVA